MTLKKSNIPFLLIFAFASLFGKATAQEFSVEAFITNQPDNYILFGLVEGDNFTSLDSTFIYPDSRKVIFKFKENNLPGVYRIVLGKTPYAKIMNEAPQQFDFIFNNENIVLKTDFKEPTNNLEVVESDENKSWYDFLAKDKILHQEINMLKKELDYHLSANETEDAIKKATEYNTLQMERDAFVLAEAQKCNHLLASNMIINQRQPLLDGYLSVDERNDLFRKEYFNVLDFSDERLIRSAIYTDKVFEYLVNYNNPDYTKEQREKEYIKAVDFIIPGVNKNEKVYRFIREYLINGFKILQLQSVIDYINKNYPV